MLEHKNKRKNEKRYPSNNNNNAANDDFNNDAKHTKHTKHSSNNRATHNTDNDVSDTRKNNFSSQQLKETVFILGDRHKFPVKVKLFSSAKFIRSCKARHARL